MTLEGMDQPFVHLAALRDELGKTGDLGGRRVFQEPVEIRGLAIFILKNSRPSYYLATEDVGIARQHYGRTLAMIRAEESQGPAMERARGRPWGPLPTSPPLSIGRRMCSSCPLIES